MDAKRIIPVLQVRDGQVASAEGPVPASTWARRLELEGADGILFRVGAGSGAQWIREVAGTLSIPFTLEAPLRDWAELEEILEAGADKVVLSASVAAEDPLLAAVVGAFGRSHVAVAVNACLAADGRWLVDPASPCFGCVRAPRPWPRRPSCTAPTAWPAWTWGGRRNNGNISSACTACPSGSDRGA